MGMWSYCTVSDLAFEGDRFGDLCCGGGIWSSCRVSDSVFEGDTFVLRGLHWLLVKGIAKCYGFCTQTSPALTDRYPALCT